MQSLVRSGPCLLLPAVKRHHRDAPEAIKMAALSWRSADFEICRVSTMAARITALLAATMLVGSSELPGVLRGSLMGFRHIVEIYQQLLTHRHGHFHWSLFMASPHQLPGSPALECEIGRSATLWCHICCTK
jgi:hypothetical protein